MRSDFLSSLHCPYSGSPLSLSVTPKAEGEEIHYGIVSSEAGHFPILEGILRLQIDEYRESIVEYVQKQRFSQALTIALDETPFAGRNGATSKFIYGFAFKSGFKSAAEQLARLKRNFVRAVTDSGMTFAETVRKLSPGPSGDWQICRFSMPTFLPTFPLVHIARATGPVLDFGCGTGQASFLISRMHSNVKIVCADYSFCSLYMAKKYFVPEASYVCLDGDYLLPFDSGQFATVLSSDALHYIDSKLSLAQEFKRVGRAKSVIILPHLHNRRAFAYAKSLTPRGYRKLFQDMEARVMPEEQVIRDYFFDDAIDLGKDSSDEDLATAEQGLSIVASADSSVFKRTEGLWDRQIRTIRHPLVNPAYRITGRPGNWELKRWSQDRYAQTMTRMDRICLPDTCKVTAPSLDSTGLVEFQRNDPSRFAQLVKSLVVLDLPERFMDQSLVLQHDKNWSSARQQAV
jgi:SAM-dependent methyltransferase